MLSHKENKCTVYPIERFRSEEGTERIEESEVVDDFKETSRLGRAVAHTSSQQL